MRLLVILLSILTISPAIGQTWKYVGPDGGRVEQLVPDRSNPALWYSIVNNQLYVSHDFGHSWSHRHLQFAHSVNNVFVHPLTSRVYVTSIGLGSYRLWQSNDQGESFQIKSLFPRNTADIFYDPTDPQVMYASDVISLMKSTNGGQTWRNLPSIPHTLEPYYKGCTVYQEIANAFILPWDPKTIFVSGSEYVECGHDSEGFRFTWWSKDGGQKWKVYGRHGSSFCYDPLYPERVLFSGSGLRIITPKGIGNTIHPEGFGSIISIPDRPEMLLAVANGKVIRSNDLGRSWKQTLLGPNNRIDNVDEFQSVDDHHGGLLLGTNQGVFYRSRSGSWFQASKGITQAETHRVIRTSQPDTIYALAGIAYYQLRIWQLAGTNDGGRTWRNVLPPRQYGTLYDVTVHPNSPSVLFGITSNAKIIRSNDGGNTWNLVDGLGYPRGWGRIQFDFFNPKRIYVTADNELFRSDDGGRTFNKIRKYSITIGQIVPDLHSPDMVYFVDAFGGAILKSADAGTSFMNVSVGLPDELRHLSPLGPKDDYIATRTNVGLAWRTRDGGKSWEKIPGTAQFAKILSADAHGTHLFGVSYYAIFESMDAGKTWKKFTDDLDRLPGIFDMTDPSIRPIYLGTEQGVWKED